MNSRSPDPGAVTNFIATLERTFPGLGVDRSDFPSGGLFLDVRLHGRVWVLMYSPQHEAYGVDELLEDDGFTTGYAHSAPTFEDATRLLVGLLRAADSPQAD